MRPRTPRENSGGSSEVRNFDLALDDPSPERGRLGAKRTIGKTTQATVVAGTRGTASRTQLNSGSPSSNAPTEEELQDAAERLSHARQPAESRDRVPREGPGLPPPMPQHNPADLELIEQLRAENALQQQMCDGAQRRVDTLTSGTRDLKSMIVDMKSNVDFFKT